jgi:putative DNA primase/helicase
MIQEMPFAVDPGGKLFAYRDGAYRPGGERLVRTWVPGIVGEDWSRSFAEEVVEYIRVSVPEVWQRPPDGIVNVSNGLLKLSDRELLPHTPEHLSPVQIPVTYDPDAECVNIKNFVAEVFPEDAIEFAFELPGVLLVPGLAQEKALLFLGPGGNGRSTYLKMLENFLGKPNIAAVSLHRLEVDRFTSA